MSRRTALAERHRAPGAGIPAPTGAVTSGVPSPTLGEPIAMADAPPDAAAPGTMLDVGIREAPVAFEVVPLPF